MATSCFFSSSFISINDNPPIDAPANANGTVGIDGIIAKANIIAAAIPRATGKADNWVVKVLPKLFFEFDLVTRIPAAVEISNAGTWLTSPSPIVKITKRLAASPADIPIWVIPIIIPPKTFITVIIIPATASPLTNLDAPSMVP